MKKFILAVVLACVCGGIMTSCDKDVRKCYKLNYTVEVHGVKTEVTTYQWASANEIEPIIADIEKNFNVKVSKTVATSHKTLEDCAAANTGN